MCVCAIITLRERESSGCSVRLIFIRGQLTSQCEVHTCSQVRIVYDTKFVL